MRKSRIFLPLLVLCLSVPALAATVRKKSGEVVEGKILGRIAQKGSRENSISFVLRQGDDITAIDEQGVHLKKKHKVELISVSYEGVPAPDSEMLNGRGGKGSVMRITGTAEKPLDRDPIVGEVRQEMDEMRLIPAIVVQTKQGPVTIPLGEIVEFTPTP